jgi:peptide/nickel transport system substrate-binding protein
MNGTGAFSLDHWTKGTEIVLAKNPTYWGTAPALDKVVIQIIPEWGTRFAELQAGDADIVDVPVENRSQVDALVSEFRAYDAATNTYGPAQQLCSIDSTKTGVDKFIPCAAGKTGTGPFRLYIGRPGIVMDVILFNFNIH